jgi:hypothetical protein
MTHVMGIFSVELELVAADGIASLGDDAGPNLVGAQTLETFGLGVDPLARRLVPVDAYLAAGTSAVIP